MYIYHDYLTPAHVSRLAAAAAPHDDLLRLLPLGPVFNSPKKVAELGEKVPKAVRGYGLGYRHMCRYFCGPIFAEAELQQFEYIWRLDSDSFLLGPAAADPIQSVAARNATYGWIHAYRDEQARADIAPADLDPTISTPPHPSHQVFVTGLWDLTSRFLASLNISTDRVTRWLPGGEGEWARTPMCFATNCFVARRCECGG